MTAVGTSGRLLTLLSLLQSRGERTGPELTERLGVSARTLRRDIERLRDLGYPVESVPGPSGGYRLRAGAAMPPLLLDDEEAVAIAVGLLTAARSGVTGVGDAAVRALVKLEQVLPAPLRAQVEALSAIATSVAPGTGPTVAPAVLTALAGACRDRVPVRFDYTAREGEVTRREAEPHALVNHHNRWYLVAWDRRRDDWRTFRLDRMGAPWAGGARFDPRTLPGGDAAAHVASSIRRTGFRHQAVVLVHAPREEVEGRPWAWGAVEAVDAATCRLRTGDDDLDWLLVRLLMIGHPITLEGPPELGAAMAALADRLGGAAARSALGSGPG